MHFIFISDSTTCKHELLKATESFIVVFRIINSQQQQKTKALERQTNL